MVFLKRATKLTMLAFLLSIFALAACARAEDDAAEGLTVVNVNEVVRSVFYAPQYVAIELGFFADEGLEIVLETGQGADRSMVALISGEADIGLMGTEAAIYVYIEGRQDHATIFAQLTQRAGNFLVAREEMPGFTWDDVRGMTIIGGRPGGMPQMVLEYVLHLHDIEPGTDVEIITNLAFTTTAGAFVGGVGDFTAEFDPSALEIEKSGHGHVVTGLANYTAALPYTVYMANRSFIEANPDIIQRFTNAIGRGQQWVRNHSPADIAEVIAPFFPHSDLEDLIFIVNRYQSQDTWLYNPLIDEAGFYLLQDIMEHGGELGRRVDFDTLVDNSFAEASLGAE
ncbi:MAG: ABC transporter substrate-binding protein [Defluviitaleaceae bacterium]|nr:ABC transporter substrate-binding protein [Defluviitaleaceae bacterium]